MAVCVSAGGSAMASEANLRLNEAAERGDVAEIERLVAAGADPNVLVGDWTPLLCAAERGHVAAIAALLAAGARVDGKASDGWTPLSRAAVKGNTATVDALLSAGADVHQANARGDTALFFVSRWGHIDATRVLVEAGARTDARNHKGKRPIDVVRAPLTRSLVAAARTCLVSAPPRRLAQVCVWAGDKSKLPALRALLASAAPWSRRRPVAIACYGVEWEWEA
jgi:ankyrin repeat protein